jgi:predicted site-specific integrase-resolvase
VAAFCAAKGWQVAKVVKECGGGVNDQRPPFLALRADTSVSHIVVDHQDRCSRFGVAYLQTLLRTQGRELVIINEAEADQEDLLHDFVAIITSFCARLYGRRRASRTKTQLLAALEGN